jgi:hypothetical protein
MRRSGQPAATPTSIRHPRGACAKRIAIPGTQHKIRRRHLILSLRRFLRWVPETARYRSPLEKDGMISFELFPYKGMLSCFFQGFSTRLSRSMLSARQIRRRVLRGRMTSSI